LFVNKNFRLFLDWDDFKDLDEDLDETTLLLLSFILNAFVLTFMVPVLSVFYVVYFGYFVIFDLDSALLPVVVSHFVSIPPLRLFFELFIGEIYLFTWYFYFPSFHLNFISCGCI
jgi:hypothetical protein